MRTLTRERATLGVPVAHSRGTGEYRSPGSAGEVSSTLAGLYPYGRYALGERVAGYGGGTLTLTPKRGRCA